MREAVSEGAKLVTMIPSGKMTLPPVLEKTTNLPRRGYITQIGQEH